MFDLVAHLGVSWTTAAQIAHAISAGWGLASVAAIASGAGAFISLFWFAIKHLTETASTGVVIAW